MVTPELLVPLYLASRSAYCGRPSPPLRSGFRVDIRLYPLDPVLPYLASTTSPRNSDGPLGHALGTLPQNEPSLTVALVGLVARAAP